MTYTKIFIIIIFGFAWFQFYFLQSVPCLHFSKRHKFLLYVKRVIFSFEDKKRNVVEFATISNKIVHLQYRKFWVWFGLRLIFCFADMCKSSLSPEQDIKFSGHVSWVGKTSMEVKMQMFQVCMCSQIAALFQYNSLKGKLIYLSVHRQVYSSPLPEKNTDGGLLLSSSWTKTDTLFGVYVQCLLISNHIQLHVKVLVSDLTPENFTKKSYELCQA